MKIRSEFTCPLEVCFDSIKGKWKPIIIWTLRLGPTQPSNLEHLIKGINQKMLMEQLKELIYIGIIGKKNYEGYPLKVEYFLTEKGTKILNALEILQSVGQEIISDIDLKNKI